MFDIAIIPSEKFICLILLLLNYETLLVAHKIFANYSNIIMGVFCAHSC